MTKTILVFLFSFILSIIYSQDLNKIPGDDGFFGQSVAIDNQNNVYTIGYFHGTIDFGLNYKTFSLSSTGNYDMFIQKMDSKGNLVWAKRFGDVGNTVGLAIVADSLGNCYATGHFQGKVDFDPGPNTYNLTSSGLNDAFNLKLSPSGDFIWATVTSGNSSVNGKSITLDEVGNILTTGTFRGTVDFNPGKGVSNITASNYDDIYIQKLDQQGNFLWAKNIRGFKDNEDVSCIVSGQDGCSYITGFFRDSCDFNPSSELAIIKPVDWRDIFVLKLDKDGNYLWAKSFGGPGMDEGSSISLDVEGNCYLTGLFEDSVDFDPSENDFSLKSSGKMDVFILKLTPAGDFVWAKSFGAADNDRGVFITATPNNYLYVTGHFDESVDFNPNEGIAELTSYDGFFDNTFIQKLDTAGNFIWAKSVRRNFYSQFIGLSESDEVLTNEDQTEIYDRRLDTKTFDVPESWQKINVHKASNLVSKSTLIDILESNFEEKTIVLWDPNALKILINVGDRKGTACLQVLTVDGQLIQKREFKENEEIEFKIDTPSNPFIIELNEKQKRAKIKISF